jgi:hypothetical protein
VEVDNCHRRFGCFDLGGWPPAGVARRHCGFAHDAHGRAGVYPRAPSDAANVPVIMASGRVEEKVRDELLTLGVKVFLDKPFTKGQLVEAIKSLLSPKQPDEL